MRFPLPLLAVVVLGAGCGDDLLPPAERRGSLRVALATTGGDVDEDGYDLLLDGVIRHHLSPNGSVTIRDLAPGTYTVALSGVAANCDVVGSQPTTVTVNASSAQAALSVQCFATGISVRTVTTGPDPDPDGYTLTVGSLVVHLDADTTRIISRLAEEMHQLALLGVASHCTPAPGNPDSVQVTFRQLTDVTLDVACLATTGNIEAHLVATGTDLDANGYQVRTDDGPPQAIPQAGGTVTFQGVPAGAHTVTLEDLSPNCTVEGAAALPVQVTAGGSVRKTFTVEFQVSCAQAARLAFTRWVGYEPSVTMVGTNGSNAVFIAGGHSPAWSPDGSKLVFTRVDPGYWGCYYGCIAQGLYVVDADGDPASLRQLTADPLDTEPAWSPDGALISFIRGNRLRTIAPDGTGDAAFFPLPVHAGRPAWSPDGSRLAFVCEGDAPGTRHVCVVNRDGTGFARLSSGDEPAWHPDGTRLAFVIPQSGDIAVMSADGTGVTLLSRKGTGPAWSPDGTWLVFSFSSNGPGLVAIRADGTGMTGLTSAYDYRAAWRP